MVCACVLFVCVLHVSVCVHASGGHTLTLGVPLRFFFPPYFMRQGLLLNFRLLDSAGLAGRRALGL